MGTTQQERSRKTLALAMVRLGFQVVGYFRFYYLFYS